MVPPRQQWDIFGGISWKHAAFCGDLYYIYVYIYIYMYIFQIYRINILYTIDRYIFIHIYTYNTSSSITQSHAEKKPLAQVVLTLPFAA